MKSRPPEPEQTNNSAFTLSLTQVSIGYGTASVVHNASLDLEPGQIGCLLGPSGCGKSTLLRGIAGFETLHHGEIVMQGRSLSSPTHTVAPEDRQVGMVFQDFALFPHLSVADNIAFGLRSRRSTETEKRVTQLLELVGLSGFKNRYPHSLSGGEQQRVALARAMAPRPKLLLLDEPFSSLDVELRQVLVPEIRQILLQEDVSAILVTHDQMEAFAMADRIGVMREGGIHQWDSGYNLYHQPATRFVANFIGEGEFLAATVIDNNTVSSNLGLLRSNREHGFRSEQHVEILIRPDDVLHDDDSQQSAQILSKHFRGSHFLYRIVLDNEQRLFCFASSHHNHAIGDRIGIVLDIDHLVMFAIS